MAAEFGGATCGLCHGAQAEVELLSRQSGLSGRQVERWFRRRRNQDRPSLLKKFREARWGGWVAEGVRCVLLGGVGGGCLQGEVSGETTGLLGRISGAPGGGRVVPRSLPALLAICTSSSSWRFTFYLIAFIAGMAVIVDVSGGCEEGAAIELGPSFTPAMSLAETLVL